MKIALFLDVDRTLTEDYIQHVYASELGVEADYKKIEQAFQSGELSSAAFGNKLSRLFASKNFSKSKAEELLDKVKLRSYVDQLFKLQEKGVDIYLVSSGPNYFIEALAERKGIPRENIKCSNYYFVEGIIAGCDAVDAQQKTRFVMDHQEGYDVTIGIGDSDRHDAFVSVCTIAMLTSMQLIHEDYIYVAHFNSVLKLVYNLLNRKSASPQTAAEVAQKAVTEGTAIASTMKHRLMEAVSDIEAGRGVLNLTVVAGTILGLGFIGGGGWLVYLGGTGESTFNLLGNSFTSANVGVASIFCGAVVAALTLRRAMITLRDLGRVRS